MKVLLLGFSKISYMPYMYFYLEQLEGHEIHLIYWDRDGRIDSPVPKEIYKSYKFENHIEEQFSIKKKLPSFLKYRRFAKKIISRENFDFIIVLHSTPGITIVDLLKKHYKNKYILDYRDISHENNKYYRNIVHCLVNNSAATFVSSNAFRKYLPNTEKVYTSHNLLLDSLNYRDVRSRKNREANPIRIRYWGLIRHTDINLAIIKKLANDYRFELHFHGREQETARILKQYCSDNKIINVFFYGEYAPNERYSFAKETDMIHNFYENDARMINATGNKIYDGMVFRIPQLCTLGSHMSELISKEKIGVGLNPYSDTFNDEVYQYYNSINWSSFENSCDIALNNVLVEYNSSIKVIENILRKGE